MITIPCYQISNQPIRENHDIGLVFVLELPSDYFTSQRIFKCAIKMTGLLND